MNLSPRAAILNAAGDPGMSGRLQPERKPDQSRGAIPKRALYVLPTDIHVELGEVFCTRPALCCPSKEFSFYLLRSLTHVEPSLFTASWPTFSNIVNCILA